MVGRRDFSGDQLLEDIATQMARELKDKGVPRDHAQQTAIEVVEYVRVHWGGQSVYIPKDNAGKLKQRDAQILAEFTGDNYQELAAKHSRSEMRIRQIINHARTVARRPL